MPRDFFQPLCPTHHKVMDICPNVLSGPTEKAESIDGHLCECSVQGCSQKYSPSVGYFTIERNEDHFVGTESSSLQIKRATTQVICGAQHKFSIFLESLDPETNHQSFRCPQRGCAQTMKISGDGAPAYWLGAGFFETGWGEGE